MQMIRTTEMVEFSFQEFMAVLVIAVGIIVAKKVLK